ncbi:MAG: hypothetical protein ACP5HU_11505, partial [Phycisphaerae bacterium]
MIRSNGASSSEEEIELPRLVNVDDELVSYLDRAESFIKEQRYSEAARALQALADRDDAGFAPADEPGSYVSLQRKAQDIIGAMPPEALEVYRRLYDPQARRLLEQATAEGDERALLRVVQQYTHTSSGPAAMDRLARIRFDLGEFGASAALWQRALALDVPETDVPMLLAKLAVAHHLAGQADASEQFAVRLRLEYPDATGKLAGRR